MTPIRPENRHRYGTAAEWAAVRAGILERAEPAPGAIPRCECEGECGRGTHVGRCPNVNGLSAYGTGSKVVLTIAHLDHTPENNDPANLRAMCNGCHLHYDREHHAATRAETLRLEQLVAHRDLQLIRSAHKRASRRDAGYMGERVRKLREAERALARVHGRLKALAAER